MKNKTARKSKPAKGDKPSYDAVLELTPKDRKRIIVSAGLAVVALLFIVAALNTNVFKNFEDVSVEDYTSITPENAENTIEELTRIAKSSSISADEKKLAKVQIASAYILLGKDAEALAQYKIIKESALPLTYEDYINMGSAAQRLSRNDEAIKYYSLALDNLSEEDLQYQVLKTELETVITDLSK